MKSDLCAAGFTPHSATEVIFQQWASRVRSVVEENCGVEQLWRAPVYNAADVAGENTHTLQASPWWRGGHVTLQVVAFLSKDKGLHHLLLSELAPCDQTGDKRVTAFLLSAIRMVSSILQSKRDSMWWMFTSHYKTKLCFHATQRSVAEGVPLHCATAEHFSATFSAEATEWKPAATAKNICSCWQSWKYIQLKSECVLIPRWTRVCIRLFTTAQRQLCPWLLTFSPYLNCAL